MARTLAALLSVPIGVVSRSRMLPSRSATASRTCAESISAANSRPASALKRISVGFFPPFEPDSPCPSSTTQPPRTSVSTWLETVGLLRQLSLARLARETGPCSRIRFSSSIPLMLRISGARNRCDVRCSCGNRMGVKALLTRHPSAGREWAPSLSCKAGRRVWLDSAQR